MVKQWLVLASACGVSGCVETFQDPAFWSAMAAASAPTYSTYPSPSYSPSPSYYGGYDDGENCDGLPGGRVCQ